MKFHLKLSENLLIQSKTNVLKYYNWKGIKVNIDFFYNFAVKYKFSKLSYTYFHPRKRIFLNNFFLVESCFKIEYVF